MTPKVAVVGAGAWGANLVRNFADLGALAAVCDTDAAVRSAVAAERGVAVYADYLALLDAQGIDAVVLATPSGTHQAMAVAALEAGKDVLVEKPAATDVAGARALVEAAERGGRVLMVGHVLRYHPAVERLCALITEGAVGRLRSVQANRLDFRRVGGNGEGVLLELATHDVSLALALIGRRPRATFASRV